MEQPTAQPYHVTLEIENRQCEGLRKLEDSGIEKYALVDIRGVPKGPTRHLIKIPLVLHKNLPSKFFAKTQIDESRKTTSAWFNTDGCDVCNTILGNSSFLVSARHVEGYSIIYSFVAPSFDAYRKIISSLESQGIKIKILEVGSFNPTSRILTEKQQRVLWVALKMGFFEYPRKITMLELSQRLGVGLSTLSEMLRRGSRRLLEDYFKTG